MCPIPGALEFPVQVSSVPRSPRCLANSFDLWETARSLGRPFCTFQARPLVVRVQSGTMVFGRGRAALATSSSRCASSALQALPSSAAFSAATLAGRAAVRIEGDPAGSPSGARALRSNMGTCSASILRDDLDSRLKFAQPHQTAALDRISAQRKRGVQIKHGRAASIFEPAAPVALAWRPATFRHRTERGPRCLVRSAHCRLVAGTETQ